MPTGLLIILIVHVLGAISFLALRSAITRRTRERLPLAETLVVIVAWEAVLIYILWRRL